jgi:hypothetical protein
VSTLIGSELPEALAARLAGEALEAVADRVILVFTVDERGWPHPAMLSYFEVVAVDRRTLRLATYTDSRTTENMRRRGKVTLVLVEEGAAFYIKGTATELAARMAASPENAKLNVRIEAVLVDRPDPRYEPEAVIASGIVYHDPQRAKQLEKARRVVAELKAA